MTIKAFKAEVARQVRARGGKGQIVWESARRVTYPTGMAGIVGYFTLAGQRYLAQYDMPTGGEKHLLSVRSVN